MLGNTFHRVLFALFLLTAGYSPFAKACSDESIVVSCNTTFTDVGTYWQNKQWYDLNYNWEKVPSYKGPACGVMCQLYSPSLIAPMCGAGCRPVLEQSASNHNGCFNPSNNTFSFELRINVPDQRACKKITTAETKAACENELYVHQKYARSVQYTCREISGNQY